MPLDRNESYWMLDAELIEAASGVGGRELSTYPEYDTLLESLARYAGVAPEQILITPGSDAAIEHLARTYAGKGGKVLLPAPTFYGYEPIIDRVGAEVAPILYEERDGRFLFPLAKTLETLVSNSAQILFLCHPNNPLGCPLTKDEISSLVDAASRSDTFIVSDEAYFEFSSGTTFLPYLAGIPNLVILRTLSKSFGLAGARVGYMIAAPDTVRNVQKGMLPWSVAHGSVTAALALLARADKVAARRAVVIATRESFRKMLAAIPSVTTYPSETNFILVRVPDALRVRDALAVQGVRVALGESMSRLPEAKKLLKDTLRIAIPTPESHELFEKIFTEALH